MLKNHYKSGIYDNLDLNCSESVLTTANYILDMGLDAGSIRLSSAFGGGMCIEEKCGAVTASLMVLGYIFVEECAHKSDSLKSIVRDFFLLFTEMMGSCECDELKHMHRTDERGCKDVIEAALETLDLIFEKYSDELIH